MCSFAKGVSDIKEPFLGPPFLIYVTQVGGGGMLFCDNIYEANTE